MSDESKELTLRVHDECTPSTLCPQDANNLIDLQAMAPTFSDLTSVLASHILPTQLRSVSVELSVVVSVSLSTSARKVELLVK